MAIKNELSELDGIKMVEGNPEAKSIDVEWEAPITEDKIKETLKEINYPAAWYCEVKISIWILAISNYSPQRRKERKGLIIFLISG